MNLDQQRRYARQAMLPEIGAAGQETLLRTRVLIVGAGGLGSALISYLAAAGIGTLGICDDDRVELSNLARQIVHETGDVGRLKIESASDRVAELNPDVKVITHGESLNEDNADALIAGYDIVADGSDNFATPLCLERRLREGEEAAGQRRRRRLERPTDDRRARRAVLSLPRPRGGAGRRYLHGHRRHRPAGGHGGQRAGTRGAARGARESGAGR